MKPFAIAGMQLELSAVRENITHMGQRLDVLMSIYPWVQMVVFSELAPFGPLTSNAQPVPNSAEEIFREWARKHGIWLLPGSMFERFGDLVYNTAMVIDPDGEIVGRYRKMFPFRPYEEGVESGTEFLVFEVPDAGQFGVSICYDLWFPETARTLAALGAEVILHGEGLVDASAFALDLARERKLVLIHPYDDLDIIRGQGTIALEMLEDEPGLDALVIPIGGGGLIAGNAVAAKGIRPDIEIVGVEAARFPAMKQRIASYLKEHGQKLGISMDV